MIKINYATYEKPTDYFKVVEGTNVIRILSDGFMGLKHGMRAQGRWIPLGECKGEECEHCAKGNEPKLKYMWIVLDRTNAKVRFMDSAPKLGNMLAELIKKNGDWSSFDIQIKRTGMDMNTKYEVSKLEPKEFTDKEKQAINLNKKRLELKYLL